MSKFIATDESQVDYPQVIGVGQDVSNSSNRTFDFGRHGLSTYLAAIVMVETIRAGGIETNKPLSIEVVSSLLGLSVNSAYAVIELLDNNGIVRKDNEDTVLVIDFTDADVKQFYASCVYDCNPALPPFYVRHIQQLSGNKPISPIEAPTEPNKQTTVKTASSEAVYSGRRVTNRKHQLKRIALIGTLTGLVVGGLFFSSPLLTFLGGFFGLASGSTAQLFAREFSDQRHAKL